MSNLKYSAQLGMDEGRAAYSNTASVVGQIFTGQKGFSMPYRPILQQTQQGPVYFDGRLPPDLTRLSDDELGQWLGLMSSWMSYVETQLAEAEMNLLAAREERDFVEAKIRLTYVKDDEGRKLTVKERDDWVRVDTRFVEANSKVIYSESLVKLMRAINNSAQNSFSALSRRITQRVSDIEKDRRGTNVSNIVNPLPPAGQPMFGPPRR